MRFTHFENAVQTLTLTADLRLYAFEVVACAFIGLILLLSFLAVSQFLVTTVSAGRIGPVVERALGGETEFDERAPSTSMLPPIGAPTDAPIGAPEEAPFGAPMDAPIGAPVDAPISSPISAPTDAPIGAPVHPPVRGPARAPIRAPAVPPVRAPTGGTNVVPVATPGGVISGEPKLLPGGGPVFIPVDFQSGGWVSNHT